MINRTKLHEYLDSSKIPVSILILTLNEEINIRACINALAWSNDIVVLDAHSSDLTVVIAKELGARVFTRVFDHFAGQRNHALDTIKFKYDWILHLDADEVVTVELRDEMAHILEGPSYDAYRVPSKIIFMGSWLRYAGMYPTYQVRFGRRCALRFKQVGHGQRECLRADCVGTLNHPYLHYCFSKGIGQWIEKHNRYSEDEARRGLMLMRRGGIGWRKLFRAHDKTERRRALKVLSLRFPFRPTLRFIYMYILKKGFLDGRVGFIYCRLLASYEYWIVLKTKELSRKNEVNSKSNKAEIGSDLV